MTATRKLAAVLVAGIVGLGALELGAYVFTPIWPGLVSSAEARIGRPLTPVSIAGVGRRTVRRCAVGIYDC
jgi:hypothetical protein